MTSVAVARLLLTRLSGKLRYPARPQSKGRVALHRQTIHLSTHLALVRFCQLSHRIQLKVQQLAARQRDDDLHAKAHIMSVAKYLNKLRTHVTVKVCKATNQCPSTALVIVIT